MIENKAVTGELEGPLIDDGKDQVLEELALAEGLGLGQTIAVGNGLPTSRCSAWPGTAIGYKPKPVVESHCDDVVTSIPNLRLYFERHGVVDAET